MRDQKTEQWLYRHGVEWYKEKDVPMSRVDWEASLKNQARLFQSLIPKHVDDIAMSILEGQKMPDPVGYYNKEGKIIIISGNHRVAAYRQINDLKLGNVEALDWYIVNTYPEKIDILSRTSNMDEGIPTPEEERLLQALHFCRVHNYSHIDAAKEFRISKTTVSTALEAESVRERLVKQRFIDTLTPTTLVKLYRIKQDDALVETAKLVKEAQLSAEETTEVAKRVVKAEASPKQQEQVLVQLRKEYKDRIARTKRGELKRQIVPTVKFRKGVNYINRTRPESVLPLEPELKRKAKSAIKKLEEITRSEQPH